MEAYELEAKCCWQDDRLHVELPELPAEICVRTPDPRGGNRVRSAKVLRYVPERTATRIVRTYDGITGVCKCSHCQKTVCKYDSFCKECGARFVETIYSEEER